MNILPTIGGAVGNFFSNLVKGAPSSNINPTGPALTPLSQNYNQPTPVQAPVSNPMPVQHATITNIPNPAPMAASSPIPPTYTLPTTLQNQQSSIPTVPARYYQDVADDIKATGMGTSTIAGQFNTENGGVWKANLHGIQNPNDIGPAQLNLVSGAVPELKSTPYFQNRWGHPFNVNNPDDNVHGLATYLNILRQKILPGAGIKNPTDDQVIAAYNSQTPKIGQAYLKNVKAHIDKINRMLASNQQN